MRRPNSAVSAAIVVLGLSAPVALAQRFFNAPPPTSEPVQAQAASSFDPMVASRGARYALRNGLDYLNYKEYSRALRYLRAAESRQSELEPAEIKELKVAIDQVQRGMREAGNTSAGLAPRGRNRPAGAIATAPKPVTGDGIQLTSGTRNVPAANTLEPTMPPPLDAPAPAANDAAVMPAAAPAAAAPVALDPAPAPLESAPPANPAPLPIPAAPPANNPAAPPDALPEPPPALPSTPGALEKPAVPAELPVPPPPPLTTPAAPAEALKPAAPLDAPAEPAKPAAAKVDAPPVLSLEPLPDAAPASPAPAEAKGPSSAPAPEVHAAGEAKPADLPVPAAPPLDAAQSAKLPEPAPLPAAEPTKAPSPTPLPTPTELPTATEPKATELPAPTPSELPPLPGGGDLPKPAAPAEAPALPAAEPTKTPEPAPAMPAEAAKPTPAAAPAADDGLPALPTAPLTTGKPDLTPDATRTAAVAADGPVNPEPSPVPAPAPLALPVPEGAPTQPLPRDETPTPPPAPAADELPRAEGAAPVQAVPTLPAESNAGAARRFRPETEAAIARIAQRQDDEARTRPSQIPNLPKPLSITGGLAPAPGEPGAPDTYAAGANASTRFELSRAPSPTEAWPIRRIPIPEEFVPIQPRNWEPARKYWQAPAFCHMPLYFQDAALERYGHNVEQFFGPAGRHLTYPIDDPTQSKMRMQIVQPFWSIGLFAFQIGTLPYKLVVDPPWEAEYDLGYYRPGDRIPTDMYYLPVHGVGPVLPPISGRKW